MSTTVKIMGGVLVLALLQAGQAAAATEAMRSAFLSRMTNITIEDPRRADGSPRPIVDGDLSIWAQEAKAVSTTQIRKALASYMVVTEEEWMRPAAQLVGTNRVWTGRIMLKDGSAIRWLMPQEGLLGLHYPDGQWLFLLAPELVEQPHTEVAWEPVAAQAVPGYLAKADDPVERCQASAETAEDVKACVEKLLPMPQPVAPQPAPATDDSGH